MCDSSSVKVFISYAHRDALDLALRLHPRLRQAWARRSTTKRRRAVMKRPKRDPVREDRIYNEAIVDASPQEQAMSWYYYLDGKISFPFRAKCLAANAVSPLRKG